MADKVKEGIDVLICHPRLVQTGLDLSDFPTICWYETDYSVYVMRQASRRSWRIGQTRPVKVVFMSYRNTLQADALKLVAKKMQSSLAVEGELPEDGIPLDDLTGALKGTRFEGAALACSWVLAETGNFFLDHCYDDGSFDGFCDPWEDDIIAEGTEEWRKATALMEAVSRLTDWLEDDLSGRFAEMLDFVLERLPDQQQDKEDNDHEQ